jgi:hypothetical protein
LLGDQSTWGKSGDIEPTVALVLTSAELAHVKQVKDNLEKIEAALTHDMSIGRSLPLHGRIVVRGNEVFAHREEPEKVSYKHLSLKRYPDEKLGHNKNCSGFGNFPSISP